MHAEGEQPYRQNDTRDAASRVDRPDGKLSKIDIFEVESLWEDFGEPIDGNTAGLVVEEKRFSIEQTSAETELSNMVVSLDNGASEVVKDICVDEGLHSLSSNFDYSAANGNHRDIMKEITDGAAAGITGDMESRSVNGPLDSNSGAEHFLSDSFSNDDKPKAAEEITGDICSAKISLKDLLSANDCASEPQKLSHISLNFSSSDRKRSFKGETVEQVSQFVIWKHALLFSSSIHVIRTSLIFIAGYSEGKLRSHICRV